MDQINRSSQPIDFTALQQVLVQVEQLIGEENLTYNKPMSSLPLPPQRNASQFRSRAIHAVIRPHTVKQVQQIIRLFNQFKTHIGLHAISTGKNWGL
ncbi:hypothetical protein [Yersinia sp. 1652 StPb PI]|uniref:hypothetical protein n=1 Tax=Yersinia sp. 1652 StPb PI TaxID=3061649 RepID=UPI00355BCAC1